MKKFAPPPLFWSRRRPWISLQYQTIVCVARYHVKFAPFYIKSCGSNLFQQFVYRALLNLSKRDDIQLYDFNKTVEELKKNLPSNGQRNKEPDLKCHCRERLRNRRNRPQEPVSRNQSVSTKNCGFALLNKI